MVVVGATICIVACLFGFFLIVYRANSARRKGCDNTARVSNVPRIARPRSHFEDGRVHRDHRVVFQPRSVPYSRVQESGRNTANGSARW